MLLIVVFPFLHMLNLDVHGEAFSHKLNLIAEPLDQYPCVTLDLIKAIIMRVEPLVYPVESLVNLLESLVDLLEALIDPIEPHVECLKPPIEILNEFLVHTAPFASEG